MKQKYFLYHKSDIAEENVFVPPMILVKQNYIDKNMTQEEFTKTLIDFIYNFSKEKDLKLIADYIYNN